MHPDQKYIDALLNNDTALLDELYNRFASKIRYMVLQNNGTVTEAADLFQDALLSIYKQAKEKMLTLTCPFEAYFYQVCKNKWRKQLKSRWKQSVTIVDPQGYNDVALGEDSFSTTEESKIVQTRKDLITEKLAELGGSCKELLRLSWSGKPMEEVAQILGITYGFARKKKSECMAKLIGLMKKSPQFNALKW
jgi:RNA polymerase sigma factor (sigma-70 family)